MKSPGRRRFVSHCSIPGVPTVLVHLQVHLFDMHKMNKPQLWMKEGGEKSWEEPYTFWQTQCELRKHRQVQVARERGPICVPGEGSLEEAGRAEQHSPSPASVLWPCSR